jgi:apolipoprotein N-acyltransferase
MRWNVPIAAWLAPVFLIRFCRSQDTWYKTLVIVPLLALAAFAKFHGGWDVAIGAEIGLGFVLAAPMLIALYLDRAFTRRVGGLGATLVYPLVYTTLEYLFGLTPVGTSLSIGVTQFEFLSFIQLASITSIWGISFIISWFASTVNVLWENGFDIKKVLKPSSGVASLLLVFSALWHVLRWH